MAPSLLGFSGPNIVRLRRRMNWGGGGGRGKCARAAAGGMPRFCFSPDEGKAPWSSAGAMEGPPHQRVTPTLVPALPPADTESNGRAGAPQNPRRLDVSLPGDGGGVLKEAFCHLRAEPSEAKAE